LTAKLVPSAKVGEHSNKELDYLILLVVRNMLL
jgi:hypothetical protein